MQRGVDTSNKWGGGSGHQGSPGKCVVSDVQCAKSSRCVMAVSARADLAKLQCTGEAHRPLGRSEQLIYAHPDPPPTRQTLRVGGGWGDTTLKHHARHTPLCMLARRSPPRPTLPSREAYIIDARMSLAQCPGSDSDWMDPDLHGRSRWRCLRGQLCGYSASKGTYERKVMRTSK